MVWRTCSSRRAAATRRSGRSTCWPRKSTSSDRSIGFAAGNRMITAAVTLVLRRRRDKTPRGSDTGVWS